MKHKIEQQLMAEMSRRNIDMVVQLVLENPEAINPLIELILRHNHKVSMRAAWVLEKLSEKLHEPAAPYLETLILELNNIKISGTRRILSKVFMLHTLPEKHEATVFDFCISMIESPKEAVAVKANCMTVLFNLLPKYPELQNEIVTIIEDQLPNNTVGFGARFNVLKQKLKQT